MGNVLRWVGIAWAVLGIVSILYGVGKVAPDFASSLGVLAASSPYTGGLADTGRFRPVISAMVVFMSVTAYVIPGLLLAGVGTLIGLQQRQSA